MCGCLVGLSSYVAYAQQAATHVEITANETTTVHGEIIRYDVSNKGLDVVNVKFDNENKYHLLSSKITEQSSVPVHFVPKCTYFRNLHESLDRVDSNIINYLIPSSYYFQQNQKRLPYVPYPVEDFLWLDKEYQLLALKKMMACDKNAPFLLTGPFGTGKTRVLATAAIAFLKRPANRVLICTSHLQLADAYIDNYFGPMAEYGSLPHNVDPVRLVSSHYYYFGKYQYLFKNIHDYQQVKRSRLIITTFLTAPQLINLKVKYFTHILIDEGGQTREPETIAPLCLANEETKIVIAGDFLQVCMKCCMCIVASTFFQIGPQVSVLGDIPLMCGLGQSLLWRLCELYHIELRFDNPYMG